MLKRKNLTIPFYMDPWFWVKLMVFIIFLLFLVWPFSSIIIKIIYLFTGSLCREIINPWYINGY